MERIIEFREENTPPTEEELRRLRGEAFAWAEEEQQHFMPEARLVNMRHPELAPHKYGVHISWFESPEGDRALARVYWTADRKIMYYRLNNLPELRREHPELTALMLLNGVYAYLKAEQPLLCRGMFNE